MDFTISTLKPGIYYIIKKGGINFTTVHSDTSGKIQFNNSGWHAGAFSLIEGAPGNFSTFDMNLDGVVNIADLVIVVQHFNESTTVHHICVMMSMPMEKLIFLI